MSEMPLLGVIATSAKPDERRLPIHPAHIEAIDPAIRARMLLEEGYGARFGIADERLAALVAGLRPRAEVLAEAGVVVLPKPEAADLLQVREGATVWGWPHCVQGPAITQAAIDRRLTLIAWEAMNVWADNCILQDTDAPLVLVALGDLDRFAEGTLFIDVSCDEGMGFEWSRPTSFREPLRTVGRGMRFYAVDHSPSYLWDSATWSISEALLPYLPAVMAGREAVDADETLRRAVEVRDGVVLNPKILSFQRRAAEYPHRLSA